MPSNRRRFLGRMAALGLLGRSVQARSIEGDEPAEWPDSPFLEGNYAPVAEEVTAEALRVIGAIPDALEGMYVRNGPNPQFPATGNYHWFDGDGMLHGVLLRDGRASYRNRWVRTAGFEEERDAGHSIWGGLADPPKLSLLARGRPLFKNAANTAVIWHEGKLLTLWEGGEPYAVAAPDLETIGPETFDGRLRHAFTAHPKRDPITGELLCFGYQPVRPYLRYSVIDADGVLRSTTPIELPEAVMMHDFAITEHYSIFMDLPATFSFARALRGDSILKYEADRPSRFGILPRHGEGSEIRWFESPPCYVFHTLNAFEDGDEVVLLAIRYGRFPGALGMGGPPTDEHPGAPDSPDDAPRLHRWRFNLLTGRSTEETLDDLPCEFPRINDQLLGRPSRYGYALDGPMGALLKFDHSRNTTTRHPFGPGRFGGEGVFVPRPGGSREDDGWLLTFVFDRPSGTSELTVIDTLAFDTPPIARVLIPARIPFGFHGTWVPSDLMD